MRLLTVMGGVVLAILLLWIAALKLLPDAPASPKQPAAAAPLVAQPVAIQGDNLLAMPIAGIDRAAVTDSWGDPRDNGLRAHHGTDIIAPQMTPVHAVASGTIEKLFQSKAGGTTIYQRTLQRDWTLYYAHLAGYAPGLHEGQAVRTGDVIGFVGDTGDAGPGNYHLHFGLTRTTPDQRWYQGEDVDPWPYLARRQPLR